MNLTVKRCGFFFSRSELGRKAFSLFLIITKPTRNDDLVELRHKFDRSVCNQRLPAAVSQLTGM